MSMPEPYYQISRKSDPRIDCYPFFICSEEAVPILRVGETVSVTLAFCTVPSAIVLSVVMVVGST